LSVVREDWRGGVGECGKEGVGLMGCWVREDWEGYVDESGKGVRGRLDFILSVAVFIVF
jgi:hypothetical protein